jgi:tRNA(Ile)-lysidine synthase
MTKQFDFDFLKHTEKLLLTNNFENKKLLLGISGGVDSVVLFHHLNKFAKKFPMEFSIAYVHHGLTSDEKQSKYRDRAFSFVKKLAEENQIPFFTNEPQKFKNKSEEHFRNLRNDFFKKTMEENNLEILVKAHNRDDLLETRLIRLVRGVGDQGFDSMSELDENIFRPLLTWTRADIEKYASKYEVDFVQDPSNKDKKYLRNWIRNSWLVDLEKYRPGAKSSLMRSLENISQFLDSSREKTCDFSDTIDKKGILRHRLITLNKLDQRRVLAFYLNKMDVKNYSHSQIDEIIKRLDSSKRELTFHVMGCDWSVDTKHICID